MTTSYRPLQRDADDPLWMQLMLTLREEIQDGRIGPDQALPSEAELSDRFAVSRTVVREALRELVQQRLVYKVKGRGTFVAPAKTELRFISTAAGSADELRSQGRRVTTQTLEQSLGQAGEWEAGLLSIPVGDPVVRLRRLRRVDGQPWLLVNASLPSRLVPGLERAVLENQSLYDVLRRRYGLEPHGADRWIDAVFPGKEDAALLAVSSSTPLLGIESVAWRPDGARFEAYRALHRSDQVRFYVGIR